MATKLRFFSAAQCVPVCVQRKGAEICFLYLTNILAAFSVVFVESHKAACTCIASSLPFWPTVQSDGYFWQALSLVFRGLQSWWSVEKGNEKWKPWCDPFLIVIIEDEQHLGELELAVEAWSRVKPCSEEWRGLALWNWPLYTMWESRTESVDGVASG